MFMKRKRILGLIIIAIIVAIFALTGCADVSHVQQCLPPTEHTYGFWGGTWHGIIMVPSFICSLIFDDVAVYAVNNNGGWYNFTDDSLVFLTWFCRWVFLHVKNDITCNKSN